MRETRDPDVGVHLQNEHGGLDAAKAAGVQRASGLGYLLLGLNDDPTPMGGASLPKALASYTVKSTILITTVLLGSQCAAGMSSEVPSEGTGYRAVSLAAPIPEADPIASQVVAETPHVKTVLITLRDGATLAEHSTPHAASIQALSGSGTVQMGDALEEVSPNRMLLLDPGVKHEVVAAEGTDLVLLVHHMKRASS
jgi:quercetin dioxygenase-like cupin family protein